MQVAVAAINAARSMLTSLLGVAVTAICLPTKVASGWLIVRDGIAISPDGEREAVSSEIPPRPRGER